MHHVYIWVRVFRRQEKHWTSIQEYKIQDKSNTRYLIHHIIYIYISSCPAGILRHRAYKGAVTKIHPKSFQNPKKLTKNHRKSRFRGVRGALGRGLGAMVTPRGAQEPKNSQKPRSRDTLGRSFGSPFSALCAFFRCLFVDFYQNVFL